MCLCLCLSPECVYIQMYVCSFDSLLLPLFMVVCSLATFMPKEYVKVKGVERAIFQVHVLCVSYTYKFLRECDLDNMYNVHM